MPIEAKNVDSEKSFSERYDMAQKAFFMLGIGFIFLYIAILSLIKAPIDFLLVIGFISIGIPFLMDAMLFIIGALLVLKESIMGR